MPEVDASKTYNFGFSCTPYDVKTLRSLPFYSKKEVFIQIPVGIYALI